MSALFRKTSKFGHALSYCGFTRATLSLKALFQTSLIDTNAFTLSLMKLLGPLNHIAHISCTRVLATFIFCKEFGTIHEVGCQPHRGEDGFDSLLLVSERLCSEPSRMAPTHASATRSWCLSSSHICAHTSRAKQSAACPRPTFCGPQCAKNRVQSLSANL